MAASKCKWIPEKKMHNAFSDKIMYEQELFLLQGLPLGWLHNLACGVCRCFELALTSYFFITLIQSTL